jgi:hypothetical protein
VGQEIVRTDIPSNLLSAFVDLATEVKGSQVRSVVFRASSEFAPSNPDYAWVHEKVRRALHPGQQGRGSTPTPTPTSAASPSPSASPTVDPADATDAADVCGYHPVS